MSADPRSFPLSNPAELFHFVQDSTKALTVLIVEDEKDLSHLLLRSIERMGFRALIAQNGQRALEIIKQRTVILVLLDVRLPQMDGYTLCSEMRKVTTVPIIMLTALGRPDDVVRGLEAGADDYIVKPFRFADLTVRMYALLRRAYWTDNQHLFERDVVRLRPENQEVIVYGRPVKLSPTEFKLLHLLSQSAEETVSYERLMMDVWGYQPTGKAAILHTNIRRLREKIERNPAEPLHIVTVAGFGYKFIPSLSSQSTLQTHVAEHQ